MIGILDLFGLFGNGSEDLQYAKGGEVGKNYEVEYEISGSKHKATYMLYPSDRVEKMLPPSAKIISIKETNKMAEGVEIGNEIDFEYEYAGESKLKGSGEILSKNGDYYKIKVTKGLMKGKTTDVHKSMIINKMAKGGSIKNYKKFGKENSDLVNFNLDKLDPFEEMQYNNFSKSMEKAEALQILINNVEGDYSQLSTILAKIAEKQYPSDELEDDNSSENYAKGGGIYSSDDAYVIKVLVNDELVEEKIIRARNQGEANEMAEDLDSLFSKKYGDHRIVVSKAYAKGGGVIVSFSDDTNSWFDEVADKSKELENDTRVLEAIEICNKEATKDNLEKLRDVIKTIPYTTSTIQKI
jgi:hypothetical protein